MTSLPRPSVAKKLNPDKWSLCPELPPVRGIENGEQIENLVSLTPGMTITPTFCGMFTRGKTTFHLYRIFHDV